VAVVVFCFCVDAGMNAIDYKELRRQERRRLKAKASGDGVESNGTIVADSSPSTSTSSDNVAPSTIHLFATLLPHNKLSNDIHRISSPLPINSVFYARHFLDEKSNEGIASWIKTIPDYSYHRGNGVGTKRLSEQQESLQHNGKWTRLRHAKRKGELSV
jgi:hypothetical protein